MAGCEVGVDMLLLLFAECVGCAGCRVLLSMLIDVRCSCESCVVALCTLPKVGCTRHDGPMSSSQLRTAAHGRQERSAQLKRLLTNQRLQSAV